MKSECEFSVDLDQNIVITQTTRCTVDEYLEHATEVYKYAFSLRGDINAKKMNLLEDKDG